MGTISKFPELARRCAVYEPRGERHELAREDLVVEEADYEPVRTLMSHELVCARPELGVTEIVHLMIKHRVGCIPVVDDDRRPIGVITKFDIVERLDGTLQSVDDAPVLAERTAQDVMTPLTHTLDADDSILHAGSMMVSGETHHILVVAGDGSLLGVVSSKDIVSWLVANREPVRTTERISAPNWYPLEG
jgi:CBS domain-containing protein